MGVGGRKDEKAVSPLSSSSPICVPTMHTWDF